MNKDLSLHKTIIIGGGRSFYETDIVEQIANSGFKGHIIICERQLKPCIERGIDPTKFNVSVLTQEIMPTKEIEDLYINAYVNPTVLKYKGYLKIWLSCVVGDRFLDEIKKNFINVNFYHRLSYNCTIDSLYIDPYMPMFSTWENAGLGCHHLARLYGSLQVACLGLDFEKYKEDQVEWSWDEEHKHTVEEITKRWWEIFTVNLSPFGRLDSDKIIRCTLDDFLTDRYTVKSPSQENGVEF